MTAEEERRKERSVVCPLNDATIIYVRSIDITAARVNSDADQIRRRRIDCGQLLDQSITASRVGGKHIEWTTDPRVEEAAVIDGARRTDAQHVDVSTSDVANGRERAAVRGHPKDGGSFVRSRVHSTCTVHRQRDETKTIDSARV